MAASDIQFRNAMVLGACAMLLIFLYLGLVDSTPRIDFNVTDTETSSP